MGKIPTSMTPYEVLLRQREGKSLRDIAKEFGVSHKSVANVSKRASLEDFEALNNKLVAMREQNANESDRLTKEIVANPQIDPATKLGATGQNDKTLRALHQDVTIIKREQEEKQDNFNGDGMIIEPVNFTVNISPEAKKAYERLQLPDGKESSSPESTPTHKKGEAQNEDGSESQ